LAASSPLYSSTVFIPEPFIADRYSFRENNPSPSVQDDLAQKCHAVLHAKALLDNGFIENWKSLGMASVLHIAKC
jgi:hypothetical protein